MAGDDVSRRKSPNGSSSQLHFVVSERRKERKKARKKAEERKKEMLPSSEVDAGTSENRLVVQC